MALSMFHAARCSITEPAMEYDYLNDDAEYNDEPVRNRYKRLDPSRPQKVKQHNADVMSSLVKMVEGNQAAVVGFNPTYKGSRHERQWIIDALEGFYEDNHIRREGGNGVLLPGTSIQQRAIDRCQSIPATHVPTIT
jgi:hypothetical protein